jgi:hypothetical protein
MATTKAYPPGGTFLDTVKRSFTDVPVDKEKDNAVATTEFLEAAESLTTLFGTPLLTLLPPRAELTDIGRCTRLNGIQSCEERHAGQRQGTYLLLGVCNGRTETDVRR